MQRHYATLDDWEPHRATITRLYQEENKTLRETMDIMAREHGFFATYAVTFPTPIMSLSADRAGQSQNVQDQAEEMGPREESRWIPGCRDVESGPGRQFFR